MSSSRFGNRIIVRSSFSERHIVSFGIALFCTSTRRWLMVRPLTTPNFSGLLRGFYRPSGMENILRHISPNELASYSACIHSPSPAYAFRALYTSKFKLPEIGDVKDTEKYENDYSNAIERFLGSMNEFHRITSLPDYTPAGSLEWTWPKGRRSADRNETTALENALREFEEETGISSSLVNVLDIPPPSDFYRSNNGRIYETQCWIATIDQEIELSEPEKAGEIGARAWLDYTQIEAVFTPRNEDCPLSHSSRLSHFITINNEIQKIGI